MQHFTNAELADINLMYEAVNRNGRAAQRLYRERFPNREILNHQTFKQVHRQLHESGFFNANRHDVGRPCSARTVPVEEDVICAVEHNFPQARELFPVDWVRQTLVWEILHAKGMHPYRLQRVQTLIQADFPLYINFSQWYLQQAAVQPDFPPYSQMTQCSLERVCLTVTMLMFGNMTILMRQYLMLTSRDLVLMCGQVWCTNT
ncbi:uncharacterized protein LOC111623730 [Centruroides sculpturatus]|uniref:uncharacterized protein LOC111623730 n=1 Tax=Centruroides sculpturatus TaxID=218467 RepID=UPI000C6CF839|nr:uncharacterized protein LOC111623730 [Centruroides sculpturatus]